MSINIDIPIKDIPDEKERKIALVAGKLLGVKNPGEMTERQLMQITQRDINGIAS
ncbi:MAG: hypothetical protein WC827_03345 [Candidatus Paceibacterota bacterium]|jgi:hypothetical protein